MSLVIGNILKVTDVQTYLGQLTENVFWYRLTAVPTPPEGMDVYDFIAERFQVVVTAKMAALQHNSSFHKIIRVDNASNGIDFFERAINVQGFIAGEGAPSFNALNFILRRSTLVTRNGSKRLGALSEDTTNANAYAGNPTTLTALETAFGAKLVDADTPPAPFADPVIVGRIKYTTPEGKIAYKPDLTKINPIAGATFTAVSTQRSRKAGRGV